MREDKRIREGGAVLISPFDTIGEIKANIKEAIGFHNKALGDPEYKAMEKPKWYLAILNSLELAEVFEKHLGPNESAGGLYAEIICGASPSKGCDQGSAIFG